MNYQLQNLITGIWILLARGDIGFPLSRFESWGEHSVEPLVTTFPSSTCAVIIVLPFLLVKIADGVDDSICFANISLKIVHSP